MTLRERLQWMRGAFDAWLDRVAKRFEPAVEWLSARNAEIDAWLAADRPPAQGLSTALLRLVYRLAKTVGLLLVFGILVLVVAPIVFLLLILTVGVVLSPLILVYWAGWLLLGGARVGNDMVKLTILGLLTFVGFKAMRRAPQR